MVKNWKRIIGVLFSVVFCTVVAVGMLQVARAAETENFNGASGKSGDLDWNITAEGHLTITGEGDFYYDDDNNWLKYKKYILTAEVNVKNITSTELMFDECENLRTIDVSHLDTSKVTNMGCMFEYCRKLEALDLSNFKTSNVTCMRSMFEACNNLTTLDISSFDTSNVQDIMTMFAGCQRLTTLDLSHFNTSKVAYMFGLFSFCSDLKILDISNFVNNGADMSYIFYESNALEELHFFANSPEVELPSLQGYCWVNEDNEICTRTARIDRKMIYKRVYKNNVTPNISEHIFSDYDYTIPVTGSAVVIYGNGMNKKIDGKKVNNKALTVYTDILASYKHTPNSNGTVKSSVGKVIVAVTKTNEKPAVDYKKNKVIDTSASKIAKAKIKNGQITVTAVGKEGGSVYLWVIDTGTKGVSASCPIDVKLAPKKLEVQSTTGTKLTNTKLQNGTTLDVHITGLAGSAKTEDCTYTATVDNKYNSYVQVNSKGTTGQDFTIMTKGIKNNKDTKVAITFTCDQNSKKAKFSLTITK